MGAKSRLQLFLLPLLVAGTESLMSISPPAISQYLMGTMSLPEGLILSPGKSLSSTARSGDHLRDLKTRRSWALLKCTQRL